MLSAPSSPTAPDSGRLTRIAPKPMGSRRVGSMSFLMARKMRMPPIAHMTSIRGSKFSATFSYRKDKNSIKRLVS